MRDKLTLISYALAILSGLCFVSGITILSNEGEE